ncbi:tetratricopeptide repeat protein [Microbulbifer sp. VAAC004]|uniref:tetratricopeptide repeat protein n=1 Tax=unclassified Microbulbifer TaxID=2619833 RepID=UPI004039642E
MQHRNNTKEDSTPIEPAEFSFGGEEARIPKKTSPKTDKPERENSYWPFLLGAVMLSGLVGVFWGLPQVVQAPKLQTDKTAVAKTVNTPEENPAQASPYSDAEIMQQRRDVQKILQDILALKEELQERRVELWAFEDYYSAEDLALKADSLYRKRQFMQALEKYRESLQALETLRDSIPERIELHLSEGKRALDIGDKDSALDAFNLVLTISKDHPRGLKGLERTDKLPSAWWRYIQAKDAYSDSDLDQAKSSLEQSLSVDPETVEAQALLARVEIEITERDYQKAMSSGYAAIADKNYTSAKQFFNQAQALKPTAKAPTIGLQQAKNGMEREKINKLLSLARSQEKKEDWRDALKSYTALLKKDSSLVAAVTGKARSSARAKLDDQLQELLKDPLTLSEGKRNHFARTVLADARKVNGQTPRLVQQIEDLENALTQALIPLPVRFKSDRSTSVTIYHVGRLGNFEQREIALKPGRYTAIGTRDGYRDVRREFIVKPGKPVTEVVIQCAEKVNGANNS